MVNGHKRLVIILSAAAGLAFILLAFQIKKTFSLTVHPVNEPLISLDSVNLPIDPTEPVLGNPGANVTIVAFLDFGSKSDRELYAVISEIVRSHPKDLRLIFKTAPYESIFFANVHETVATAILCASDQKKQWAYLDQLAPIGFLWQTKQLVEAASATHLDLTKFNNCLSTNAPKNLLAASIAQAKTLAPKAPSIFANNKHLNLTPDVDVKQLLTSLIAP